ncbi:hypothetical protein N9Z65_00460 [bacterium]|nr:hypothetical protein [bacterium]
MALNSDFKVKDSLYVGNNACFVGQTNAATILSAGVDLLDLFSEGDITDVTATGGLSGGGSEGNVCIGIDAATAANFSCQGTVTSVGIATGCAITSTGGPITDSGNVTVGVDLTGLTGTTTVQDEFVVTDGSADSYTIPIGCINNSGFNNDSGFTDCEGTVCSVGITAGNLIDVTGGPVTGSGSIQVDVDLSELDTSTSNGDGDFFAVVDSANVQKKLTKGNINISGFNNDSGFTDCEGTVCSVGGGNGLTGSVTTSGNLNVGAGTAITVTADAVGVTAACNTAWNSAYVSGSVPSQGTLTLTDSGPSTDTFDLGLQRGDSPTFLGLSAITLCGDGANITGVTATPFFPVATCTSIATDDKIFINDAANCATTGNKHITYGDLLTDLAGGEGIVVTGNDSLCVAGAAGLTDKLTKWDESNSCFVDSIASDDGTTLTIGGSTTIQGDLTVDGDLTCINTQVTVTSAFEICNCGTGPALYAEQEGANCAIACFVDAEGGTIVFDDGGNVGIGCTTPGQKLVVSGTACITGNTSIGGTINAPNIGTGVDNSVVILDSDGGLKTDEIDSKVWGTALVDGEGTQNKIPKYTNGTGTIGDSVITDSGSLVTIDSDTRIAAGHSLSIYATGGSRYSSDETFTATVGTGGTTVATFAKSGFRTGKYIVSLINGVNRTSFEILVTYNDTASFGTVYGIVDAQAASQLADVNVTNSGSTIDLVITSSSASTTAIIHGKAFY